MDWDLIVYKVAGRFWDVVLAMYVDAPDPKKSVIELFDGGCPADEAYLKRTLQFYNLPVGAELLTLEEVKAQKLEEINAKCEQALTNMTPTYPDKELLTFDQQKEEALAYKQDPLTITPMLTALATARGIDISTLCEKVLVKASTFSTISGTIIGQRQAYEDTLDTCTTKEEVLAINVVYSLPVS